MGKLLKAVQGASKRDMLCELRDQIAGTIEDCSSGRDMAALSKRLMEVVDEIEELDALEAKTKTPLQKAQAKHGKG